MNPVRVPVFGEEQDVVLPVRRAARLEYHAPRLGGLHVHAYLGRHPLQALLARCKDNEIGHLVNGPPLTVSDGYFELSVGALLYPLDPDALPDYARHPPLELERD